MKRYSLGYAQNAPKCTIVEGPVKLSNIFTMMEAPDGGYVKYEDAQALHAALTKLVECIEVIKFERRPDGSPPDWYDWGFINQELKKAKKILGGEE